MKRSRRKSTSCSSKVQLQKGEKERRSFPRLHIFGSIEKDQNEDIKAADEGLEEVSKKYGLAHVYESNHKTITHDHMDIFEHPSLQAPARGSIRKNRADSRCETCQGSAADVLGRPS